MVEIFAGEEREKNWKMYTLKHQVIDFVQKVNSTEIQGKSMARKRENKSCIELSQTHIPSISYVLARDAMERGLWVQNFVLNPKFYWRGTEGVGKVNNKKRNRWIIGRDFNKKNEKTRFSF